MGLDGHQNAEARHQGHHGGAAVAHQWQGNPYHRQDAAYHAHVDEHIDEEGQGQGAPSRRSKLFWACMEINRQRLMM